MAELVFDSSTTAASIPDDKIAYNAYIESMRREQYPMLKDTLYLDHAGSALPSKALLDAVHQDLLSTLFANPHSASGSAQVSATRIGTARSSLLSFFNADPELYDLVFTSNATAAIKLVGDALRELENFSYAYHLSCHTSVIGLRGLATRSECLESELDIGRWVEQQERESVSVLAYPAQSNMSGERLPQDWCKKYMRAGVHFLLDAAAYASTSPLDVTTSNADFTFVSLYKIFGFPDLGALIVKKSAAHLLRKRRYFGGGTVDMVTCKDDAWHASKSGPIYEQLEDGTLPIHSIAAVRPALSNFETLFGTLQRVSDHTLWLAQQLFADLTSLRHGNATNVCELYSSPPLNHTSQGPVIAFNILDSAGSYISTTEVEKLASINNIQLRTGSVCNPGGVAKALKLDSKDLRDNYASGYRCGNGNELIRSRPTGVVRVSLGAISTLSDVQRFSSFLREYFICPTILPPISIPCSATLLQVESLTIYPIKSCAGWAIPYDQTWTVNQEGLEWDREWCIVDLSTGKALSQKQYPRMALIRPIIDATAGRLVIQLPGVVQKLHIMLSRDISSMNYGTSRLCPTQVCGDEIHTQRYSSNDLAEALSEFLGIACTLARFPAVTKGQQSSRHSKDHLKPSSRVGHKSQPLLLSNESPILTITRSSLDAINESLKAQGKRAAHHSVFRANIILANSVSKRIGRTSPWVEDEWSTLSFCTDNDSKRARLDVLAGCRRCQMVCVDQLTGSKRPEVFLTLAKQRRIRGQVLFGVHCALADSTSTRIKVGDMVDAY